MIKRGSTGLAGALLLLTAACGGGDPQTAEAESSTTSATTTRSTSRTPTPAPTPSATATLDPETAVNECEPVTDEAQVAQLTATILPPRNTSEFALNGVVSLRTSYEGDSWTYLAARVGPTLNGQFTTVAVWALPDGLSPLGVQWSTDTDGDQSFDVDGKLEEVLSSVAETGPYYWNNDRTRVAECAIGAAGGTNVNTRMTLDQYQQLQPGSTTLDQLYALVGDSVCETTSESSIGGIETLGLTCRGQGQPGANAVLIFQNGVLVSKAQAGLS